MPRSYLLVFLSPLIVNATTGCGREGSQPHDFTVEEVIHDDITTLIELNWFTSHPGFSWVEYGTTVECLHSTPTTDVASTEHNFILYGLPSLSVVYYRAYTEVDGELLSAGGVTATGALPSGLPDLVITANVPERMSSEPYVMGTVHGIESAMFIIDRDGQWLWYRPTPGGMDITEPTTGNLKFARGSNDLLYMTFNFDFDLDQGAAWRADLAEGDQPSLAMPNAHHDFVELPNGTITYLAADVRSWFDASMGSEYDVVGDSIIELAPDGTTRIVFSSWDWQDPPPNGTLLNTNHPAGVDWTHGNAVNFNEEQDTYLISLGGLDTVLEVDRISGALLNSMGPFGELRVVDGTPFKFQHDAQWTDEGTLLMTAYDNQIPECYAIEYEKKADGTGLREIWSHGKGQRIGSTTEGRVTRLENGNTLISFGSAGILREVTPDGELVWEAQLYMGNTFLSMELFGDFYAGR